MVEKTTEEIKIKVKRTKNLVIAGKKLREYRDRIDDIIRVINSGEEFHADLADECIDIGVTFQGLPRLLRPISIEGKEKARQKKIKDRWHKEHKKAVKNKDELWLFKYSRMGTYSSWYEGPSKLFEEHYCKDL